MVRFCVELNDAEMISSLDNVNVVEGALKRELNPHDHSVVTQITII